MLSDLAMVSFEAELDLMDRQDKHRKSASLSLELIRDATNTFGIVEISG